MYVVRKHYSSSLHLTRLDLSCIYTVVHMQVKKCFIGNNALLILMAYTWLVYGHMLKAEITISRSHGLGTSSLLRQGSTQL